MIFFFETNKCAVESNLCVLCCLEKFHAIHTKYNIIQNVYVNKYDSPVTKPRNTKKERKIVMYMNMTQKNKIKVECNSFLSSVLTQEAWDT